MTARIASIVAVALISIPVSAHATIATCGGAPYIEPSFRFVTTGDLAQSAIVMVEESGYADVDVVLTDSNDQHIPLSFDGTLSMQFIDEAGKYGARTAYDTDRDLEPGTYTLSVEGNIPDGLDPSTFETSATFTITEDLPPEGALPSPELSWSAVVFDGPEDPPIFPDTSGPCEGGGPDSSTASLRLTASAPDATTIGHVTIELENADGDVSSSISSSATDAPRVTWSTTLYGDPPGFVQCATATFTDIYGRTSAPTRSCKPDGCAARHRNDRDPIDWADVDGCEDWSPGYAERNAPGCACTQAPGAPTGSPAALALLALGLLGIRRRG